jgi:hypothetical protein
MAMARYLHHQRSIRKPGALATFPTHFHPHPGPDFRRYPFMIRDFPLITCMKTFHCPDLRGARSVVARLFNAA